MSDDLATPDRTSLRARALVRAARLPGASAGSRLQAWLYRVTKGRLAGRFVGGGRIMVLETVGRRTGQRRFTPVMRVEAEDGFLVIPANGGSDRIPAWWLNLEAAGEGWLIFRGARTRVTPRVAEGAERIQLWDRFVSAYPLGANYPQFTSRRLPIVVLQSAGSSEQPA